ncbi:hypothetical protein Q4555_04490 [Octadecabacter sp. 1_MG-2023]|uniref:hypothetical protein n=1 Tax=unclassified Octadecabacter TaxID=196158 RepID=UPI001C08AA47|nr:MULTISPECIES: hypothetical protein [unclassified Octadecabacter]MBU2994795.1 hypothetical protein [Octadecabacter sp. B2R22]MDO6733911.1 hypothetical protein [Octadecabacter sp. 1_MG-2023]
MKAAIHTLVEINNAAVDLMSARSPTCKFDYCAARARGGSNAAWRKFPYRRAARETAIYADRSEDQQPNSQFPDQVAVQLHDANGCFLFFGNNET